MRCIIAGSRTLGADDLTTALGECPFTDRITEVVSGTARGVDRAGEEWAISRDIPVAYFPAEWERLGKRAGYQRNREMVDYAARSPEQIGALVAVWDGESRGTKHTIDLATAAGLKVFVWEPA